MLRKLEDFNAEQEREWNERYQTIEPHPNGIACPECGKELWDSSPAITLDSSPPEMHINCPACGYKGYRIA